MKIKRIIAKARIKKRKAQASKHEREMKSLALQRNENLKKAKKAAEKANLLEEKRKSEEKLARELAPITKAKKDAAARRKAKAKKLMKGTGEALKPLGKSLKTGYKWLRRGQEGI